MLDDTLLPFAFPAVSRRPVSAAFDGGRISSDGGVMLLALADRQLGLADRLAAVIPDRRDPGRVIHSLVDMLRARIFIALGYKDGDDLDSLRSDPALKLACGRLPDSVADLWCASYAKPPASVTLDIDDTVDVVHGHLRRLVRRFWQHWPTTRLTIRDERRTVTRIETTRLGLDIRFVVTSLDIGTPEWLYESLYCQGTGRKPPPSRTKPGWRPTAPVADPRWPTRSACSCIPPPIG